MCYMSGNMVLLAPVVFLKIFSFPELNCSSCVFEYELSTVIITALMKCQRTNKTNASQSSKKVSNRTASEGSVVSSLEAWHECICTVYTAAKLLPCVTHPTLYYYPRTVCFNRIGDAAVM